MSGLYQRTTESLEGLTDVDITNIQNGQAPVYDATQEVYTNQTILTPSSLPTGGSGDVIISNGTGGIESTINLNVNPLNGNITGSYVNVSSTTIKLGTGSLAATDAIGIGWNAGFGSSNLSVSVGSAAGTNGGSSSVSLGFAAQANQNNCIVLNASGSGLISAVASSCKIAPIRNVNATPLTSPYVIQYDDTTKEVIKSEDLHTRNIKCVDIQNGGTLTNVGTASLYNGQLTIGVTPNKIINGTNTLVVDFAGNRVGVNQLTPAEALDVNGNVKFNGKIEVSNGVGLAGQVLSSNAGSPATWINQTSYIPVFGGLNISQNILVSTATALIFTTQVATGITATSSGFTCIVPAWYNINFVIRLTTSGTTATSFLGSDLILLVNSTIQVVTSIQDAGSPYDSGGFHSGGCLVQLILGDTISFTCETPQVSTNNYSLAGRVSIVKVS